MIGQDQVLDLGERDRIGAVRDRPRAVVCVNNCNRPACRNFDRVDASPTIDKVGPEPVFYDDAIVTSACIDAIVANPTVDNVISATGADCIVWIGRV